MDLRNIYSKMALRQIPRLLGNLDRDPNSPTYGCFDRNYWHYKIIDFSNARMQEAALTLALLYRYRYDGSKFYKIPKIKEWAVSAVKFLKVIQNRNGSFDEYYPKERAFVTTSFVLYAASETILELRDEKLKDLMIDCFEKAGKFLMRKNEFEVVNQQIGSALSLYNLYLLTGKKRFRNESEKKINIAISKQSKEGWFNEYGGPDFGYFTLAIDYLAKLYKKNGDEKIRSSLTKAVDFIVYFLHPDGSIGGEYGSRNTAYVIPDGIEITAKFSNSANFLSKKILEGFKNGSLVCPDSLDDRYLLYNLYTYFQAYNDYTPKKDLKMERKNKLFVESGLYVRNGNGYFLVTNLKKGGIFKLYVGNDLFYSDSGFTGTLKDGGKISSQFTCNNYMYEKKDNVGMKSSFFDSKYMRMNTRRMFLIRSALFLGGEHISDFSKNLLRKKLITEKNKINAEFSRDFFFNNGDITIKDHIRSDMKFKDLYIVDNFSLAYIPSSRYFRLSEINTKQKLTKNISDIINMHGKISIIRKIDINKKIIDVEYQ